MKHGDQQLTVRGVGYLQEPQLSLKQVMATFREAFDAT